MNELELLVRAEELHMQELERRKERLEIEKKMLNVRTRRFSSLLGRALDHVQQSSRSRSRSRSRDRPRHGRGRSRSPVAVAADAGPVDIDWINVKGEEVLRLLVNKWRANVFRYIIVPDRLFDGWQHSTGATVYRVTDEIDGKSESIVLKPVEDEKEERVHRIFASHIVDLKFVPGDAFGRHPVLPAAALPDVQSAGGRPTADDRARDWADLVQGVVTKLKPHRSGRPWRVVTFDARLRNSLALAEKKVNVDVVLVERDAKVAGFQKLNLYGTTEGSKIKVVHGDFNRVLSTWTLEELDLVVGVNLDVNGRIPDDCLLLVQQKCPNVRLIGLTRGNRDHVAEAERPFPETIGVGPRLAAQARILRICRTYNCYRAKACFYS